MLLYGITFTGYVFQYLDFRKGKKKGKNSLPIQCVSRLVDITAGGDFLGLCDRKGSYKHVSDFGRLRSYGHFI